MTTTVHEWVQAFRRGNSHHATILQALDVEALLLRPREGARSIGEVFAHVHTARLEWLEQVGASELLETIEPLEDGDEESRDELVAALGASAEAMSAFISSCADEERAIPGHSSVAEVLARWIAHDAHHRGQILTVLADRGVEIPAAAASIWEWR